MDKYIYILLLTSVFVFAGCSKQEIIDSNYGKAQASGDHSHGASDDGHGHSHAESDGEMVPVTMWTDQMELFLEYPRMTVSTSGKFIIHLTYLDGNKPVKSGEVELKLTHEEGSVEKYKTKELLRDGIFTSTVHAHRFGKFVLDVIYRDGDFAQTFTVDDFEVFINKKSIPHSHEEESENITFLKEQQWRIPFKTVEARIQPIYDSVEGSGTVLADPLSSVLISAPVSGRVAGNGSFPIEGQEVENGYNLISLISVPGSDNWAAWKAEYNLAKLEFTQAERLIEKEAISKREFEQIRLRFQSLQKMMDNLGQTGETARLDIMSSINGSIIEVMVEPGDIVSEGDPLVQLVNNNTIQLEVSIFNSNLRNLNNIAALGIHYLDSDHVTLLTGLEFKRISPYPLIDPATNSAKLNFTVPNKNSRLAIGQRMPVDFLLNASGSSVVVPRSALYEEEGMDVVFIQVEGESFERRYVQTGAKNGDKLEIISGVEAGDRVVVNGGYQVKLAGTTSTLSHGHAH